VDPSRRALLFSGVCALAAACKRAGDSGEEGESGDDSRAETDVMPPCDDDGTDSTVHVCLRDHPELEDVNGNTQIRTATKFLLLVRTDTTTVVAASAICTHAGCELDWAAATSRFSCPCHGSVFSTSGTVLGGPAPAPLRIFPTEFDGEVVAIDVS
jgi:cytochrome b6-f complex iron-sulfur subunit